MLVVAFGLSIAASAVAVADLPEGFVDDVVFTNLVRPTNIEFASDGRVFVAEERGTIQVFPSIDINTRTQFADLRINVHYHWDRGLLGMALHPDFPAQPYLYVLYTYKRPLQWPALPEWPGSQCDDPPGTTKDGCVVSGRLSRLTASGNQMVPGSEVVLITDWCQQFPSHSIGDLVFGVDGALYVSAGDGAAFHTTDWGQLGGTQGSPPITPVNPCGDPGNLGGALRSQNPDELDGTVIRIAPEALVGSDAADPPYEVIAYGLRNPFRMTMRPGTGELFIGDVGWSRWEEVNVHPDPTGDTVLNFGWPCYEGGNGVSHVMNNYSSRPHCENLSPSAVTPSLFAYRHGQGINGDMSCPINSGSATTGLAFYQDGDFPEDYDGALFGADYSRNCIWVMYADGAGNLAPSSVEIFQDFARSPVDMEIGPDANLYYASFWDSTIRRIRYHAPVAVIEAHPVSGDAPLTVTFDGTASTASPFTIEAYEWDFEGDGVWVEGTGISEHDYDVPGSYTAWLRVTDSKGDSATDSIPIQVSNTPPEATIDSPSAGFTWSVGDGISFSGSGWDQQDGDLPESALSWEIILHHCTQGGGCHTHPVESSSGVASGSFAAPEHEYPSHLEVRLTVEDSFGATHTDKVELYPETVDLTFETDPTGLNVTVNGMTVTAPFTETWIVGATVSTSTEATQQIGGDDWIFQSWSNGGDRTQTFSAPSTPTTFKATFQRVNQHPVADAGPDRAVEVGEMAVLDGTGSFDPDGDPLTYLWSILSRPDGSSAGLVGATTTKPTLTPDRAGTYTIRLRVSDGTVNAFDQVRVLANEVLDGGEDPPPPPPSPSGSGGTFTDTDGSIFKTAIEWLAAEKITLGCNPPANDRFCPDDFVTRGQMAAFFARAFKWTNAGGGGLFVDARGSTFERDIDLMGAAGVTRGCNPPADDRFCPDEFVTRGQMAAFFVRAFGWTDAGKGDLFVDDGGSTFERSIDILGTKGVTKGCNPPANDRFCPNDFVTRAQMAAFFNRAFDVEGGRN